MHFLTLQDYQIDLLVELVDQKKEEIEMYKSQFLAQQEETTAYKNYLSEADVELQVREWERGEKCKGREEERRESERK